MQRLFSTFADGWPGAGILLLRLLRGILLICSLVPGLREASPLTVALQVSGTGAGVFLLVGLWTPVAGALVTILELWIALAVYLPHSGDWWIPVTLAALGAALAMIGPGAWSIDARLFGRKHIKF